MEQSIKRQISYVLPLSDQTTGHRLGVSGLAYDKTRSILYSAGRDGLVFAWNIRNDINASPQSYECSSYRQHTQAHTHWINDITLVQNDTALVTASSDTSVKLYRPHADEYSRNPSVLGLHKDYVKCVASPSPSADWIVAGGLDRKLCLWDLHGFGERLRIDVASNHENGDYDGCSYKGSIYGLCANASYIASGGSDKIVKIWDSKTGKRICRFVGHTDNIRCIILSQDGDLVMTGSSDQTIKVWSMVAGKCLNTLNMHNDSVWSLYSDHPRLSVFYSGDRSGFVAKSDTRRVIDLNDGLSIAVCQEQKSINKIVCTQSSIWTATAASSISRWLDIDTSIELQSPANIKSNSSSYSQSRSDTHISRMQIAQQNMILELQRIPVNCILRMSNAASILPRNKIQAEKASGPAPGYIRILSDNLSRAEVSPFVTLRDEPIEKINGRCGLVKHFMLNDKRHVLVADSGSNVTKWSILECREIASFGKRAIEDVAAEINTRDAIPNWCTVDTKIGTLTCVLDEYHCFDAEIYADELQYPVHTNLKEDQRINLGKWMLRYLFASFITEEVRRDEAFRLDLYRGWRHSQSLPKTVPSESCEVHLAGHDMKDSDTPGSSIKAATPGAALTTPGSLTDLQASTSQLKHAAAMDYFSVKPQSSSKHTMGMNQQTLSSLLQTHEPTLLGSEVRKDTVGSKDGSSAFGKRLRTPFSYKRGAKSSSAEEGAKQMTPDQDDEPNMTQRRHEKAQDTLLSTLSRIREEYREMSKKSDILVETLIKPSDNIETPPLNPHTLTTLVIQGEDIHSGDIADLFNSTVGNIQNQTTALEKVIPSWVGEFLLRNQIPQKKTSKVAFVLKPYKDLLPQIPALESGTERLNANQILRARKISAYVVDRLQGLTGVPNIMDLRPEAYLELYCDGELIPPEMTLAGVRMHIWRAGGDVILEYKLAGEGR